ncbi:MAG: N-formylglutamate amidohydrolase [Pseudomonadota bacterium]
MSNLLDDIARTGPRWSNGLLSSVDPDPVGHENLGAASPIIVLCDHAGNAVPAALGDLGVPPAAMARHVAYDPGALGVARALAAHLGAELIFQRYSRLVIDCNRPPHEREAFVTQVDGVIVGANEALSGMDAARRVAEIFLPYQSRIAAAVALRKAAGAAPVIVSVHSFTPVHGDHPGPRPWHVSVLYGRDDRLAKALKSVLALDPALTVGENEPYAVDDCGDYAIPVHAERAGYLHVEIEIRQDTIATSADQAAWGERLGIALAQALNAMRSHKR